MTFTDQITNAHDTLIEGTDPDGLDAWQALLLAHRAATVANYTTDTAASWDQYGLTIADAIEHLDAPLAAAWTLPADIHPTPDDLDRLADPVRALVQRLADVLADAVAGDTGAPRRQLVWSRVTHRLDDARKYLP